MLRSFLDWLGVGRAARDNEALDRFIAGGESIAQISAGADIIREQRRIEMALRAYILKLEATAEAQIADLEEQIAEMEGASGP